MWGGRIFSVNCSNRPSIRVFSPLTAVTDPQFVLFKHVLCFARIMSTLCPNSCRQTARIGGATAPPCPPVPYAYGQEGTRVQHWWWAARGSIVSRQIGGYKRKDKGQGEERECREDCKCMIVSWFWREMPPVHE